MAEQRVIGVALRRDTWRSVARPIIARVLFETQGQDERAIRRALREAYPFGERRFWPYKCWLDEIARQRRTGRYAPGRWRPLRRGGGPFAPPRSVEELNERIAEIEAHNRRVEGSKP